MPFKLAEAFVEVTSNLAPWEKGLKKVRSDLNGMVASAGTFGAKIGAALAGGGWDVPELNGLLAAVYFFTQKLLPDRWWASPTRTPARR